MGTFLTVIFIILGIFCWLLVLAGLIFFLWLISPGINHIKTKIVPRSHYFSKIASKTRRIESRRNREEELSLRKIRRNRRKYESSIFNICKTFSRDCGFRIIDKRYIPKSFSLQVFMNKKDWMEISLKGSLKSEEIVLEISPSKKLKKSLSDKRLLRGKIFKIELKDFSKKLFSEKMKECLEEIT